MEVAYIKIRNLTTEVKEEEEGENPIRTKKEANEIKIEVVISIEKYHFFLRLMNLRRELISQ